MVDYEKTKLTNNRERRRRNPGQKHRKYFLQNYRKEITQPKEDAYQRTRTLWNTKQTGPEKEFPTTHHHQTLNIQNNTNNNNNKRY